MRTPLQTAIQEALSWDENAQLISVDGRFIDENGKGRYWEYIFSNNDSIYHIHFNDGIFESVNKNQATLMVIFTLVGVPIAMLNTLNRLAALLLLNNPNQIMFFLDLNAEGVMIAQIFWGLWLFPLSYLIYKSGYFPKTLGVLVMLAGVGYTLDSFTHFVLPSFNALALPTIEILLMGEVAFMLWVLFKGANLPKTER